MTGSAETNNRTGIEIAVIGMAGRFPQAGNIGQFWENLKNGVESISFLSDEEINESESARHLKSIPNYVNSKGGVLENMEYFDALFFGYTPLEAEVMDPQVRIFFECAWEALENAGYSPGYRGLIGLYAGPANHFNWEALTKISGKSTELGEFSANLLADSSSLCTNVSYKLGLKGPSVLVRSACSTSLVAIHLACQAILNGECDMALAGGVSVNSMERPGYIHQEGMIYSRDGRCRAFDSTASGCIGGSGAGVVVLKLLDDALEDRDHIHALIKGSGINNDGDRKSGYTAPSVEGQSEAIIAAQQVSEVPAESITYVETHGTGTILGDPIEIEALKKGFNTDKKKFCAVGAVKTNVGHLNTAAGVTGFIKTVLALKHRLIPPSLNFETPNPEIDFENSPFFVNSELREWKRNGYPLRAGVSSFGIGGTNAHIVLEEAPAAPGYGDSSGGRDFRILLLSAKTKSALDAMSGNLAEYLKNNPGINLDDMSYTLNTGRAAFNYRRMAVCPDVNEAVRALSAPISEKNHTSIPNSEDIPVVFVFSGLGSQYVNMGLDLYKTEALFRKETDRCFEIVEPLLGYNIKDILYPTGGAGSGPSPDRFNRFDAAQVIVFIFEYALARLLIEWGIKPRAMIGYSFGEITAACVAGVFSLEHALKMIVSRGKLIRTIPGGAMLSVPLPFEKVKPLICDGVSIAIDNGLSCIAAGSVEAIAAFEEKMKEKGQMCMRIKTSMAIHSEMMGPILNEFEEGLKELKSNAPRIPYISNVTGTWMTGGDAKDPAYWKRHLRETVRFSDGINELLKKERAVFIEIGPGRDISALLGRYIENDPGKCTINLVRPAAQKVSDVFYLLNKIGVMWLRGLKIDWPAFYSGEKRNRIPLPSYPFEGQRYWIEGDIYKLGAERMKEQSQPRSSGDVSDWFYLPSWKRFTQPPVPQKKEKKAVTCNWLVFVNGSNPGKAIVDRLENQGHTVVAVKDGNGFEKKGKNAYTVNPGETGHYETLFAELRRSDVVPDKIVHCWGIGGIGGVGGHAGTGDDRPVTESFDEFQYRGFYSLLHIAKAIGAQNLIDPIEITVLTDGLHEVVGGEPLCPAKSTVLGLINSIPQEYPGIRCANIDILLPEPGTPEEDALIDTLLEELTGGTREPVVAVRNNNRWVRVFEPLHLEPGLKDGAKLRENGVYLVTGGMGKIGLMFAELFARRAGAKVVLTGRSLFPPKDEAKLKKLQQIEALGGEVLYIRADASDPEQMRDVVLRTGQKFGKINGVVHCAGIVEGSSMRVVQELSPDDCRLQFQPKVYGAAVMEELFSGEDLDFAWMLSSISGFLGGLGFGAYAAANIFMDTFVRRRNRLEKKRGHWLSLNWDGTDAEKSIDAFERLLALEKTDQVIFSVGGYFHQRFERWIKLEQVKEQVDTPGEKEDKPKGHPRPDYLTSTYVPPQKPGEKEVAAVWERILGIDDIGVDDNFLELGGDSLKAITMLAAVQKRMNVNVPLAEIFKSPTIRDLSEFIEKSAEVKYTAIESAEEKEYYHLSSAQKRLYFLQRMSMNGTAYNVSEMIPLPAGLERERIEETFKKLIERHESLRTSFHMVNDAPVQEIHGHAEFNLDIHDLNDSQSSSPRDFIKRFIRPFDLAEAPLIRAGLIIEEDTPRLLIVDMHHIVSDLVSHEVLVADFRALYEKKEIPPLRLQYKDFSEWQKGEIEKGGLNHQEEYWLNEFAGEIPVLELPYDYPRPVVQSFEGDRVNFEISGADTRALNAIALKGGSTLFMALVAAVNVLLAKLSGQEEIVIGTPIAGRRHADLEKIIGIFLNTIPLRNNPVGNRTFREFLGDVKEKMLSALENQEYPFEELVDRLFVKRDIGRNPLFDVMFVLQDNKTGPAGPGKETGAETVPQDQPGTDVGYEAGQTVKFDLMVFAEERDDGLFMSFQYGTKLFKRETVQRFGDYFRKIVSTVVEEAGIRIGEIEVISEEEKNWILNGLNRTDSGYPKDKTIYELFEEQVERTPDRIAVTGSGVQLTYREMKEKSELSARRLAGRGVEPGVIAGIMAGRSVEMILGILGILRAGGVYLPIDPGYPLERIKYMLDDSGTELLVTVRDMDGEALGKWDGEAIFLEDILECPEGDSYPLKPLTSSPRRSSTPAYVLYTSGTTGKPKGTMVEHLSVSNILRVLQDEYPMDASCSYLMKTSYLFDVSVTELFGWFMGGGRLVLLEKDGEKDPGKILDAVERCRITHINFVPSMFNVFLDVLDGEAVGRISRLKYLFLAGEALLPAMVTKFRSLGIGGRVRLENLYGPTEATVYAARYSLRDWREDEHKSVPIGKPLGNIRLYVLNENNGLQPVGVVGELCIGGLGLARGYLNRPELTAEKFNRSYKTYKSNILYRTGDLARWLPDGNIEFLGRIDSQVKIRGFRVELGEIETQLMKHEHIQNAVVLLKEKNGEKSLCAYIVTAVPGIDAELRGFLSQRLPAYVIPSYFMPLEKIPLTPNGKIDRKALPEPEVKAKEAHIPPGNDVEEALAGIWAEILQIEKDVISMDANFFALGGHSLRATVMVTKIHKELNRIVSLEEIFKTPTIEGIASLIGIIEWAENKENGNIADERQREEIEL